MSSNEIFNLENEILKIKSRITTMENYLKEHPDDFSVELSLSNLKSRHSELSLELSSSREFLGGIY